jgi:hypothetical protein
VDDAVLAKQSFETKQIKVEFVKGKKEGTMDEVTARTEAERTPLAEAIKKAFVPVTHTVKIVAE